MNGKKIVRFLLGFITLVVLLFGWEYSFLGWLVPAAMIVGVITAVVFGNRFACGNLCPRGAFLDVFISKISRKISAPFYMHNNILKALVLVAMFGFFFFSIYRMQNYNLLPLIFWKMCFITTVLGILLAFFINERAWCMVCPVGTIGGWLIRKSNTLYIENECVSCGKCDNICPTKINPSSFKQNHITHINCINCSECKNICPKKAVN